MDKCLPFHLLVAELNAAAVAALPGTEKIIVLFFAPRVTRSYFNKSNQPVSQPAASVYISTLSYSHGTTFTHSSIHPSIRPDHPTFCTHASCLVAYLGIEMTKESQISLVGLHLFLLSLLLLLLWGCWCCTVCDGLIYSRISVRYF